LRTENFLKYVLHFSMGERSVGISLKRIRVGYELANTPIKADGDNRAATHILLALDSAERFQNRTGRSQSLQVSDRSRLIFNPTTYLHLTGIAT